MRKIMFAAALAAAAVSPAIAQTQTSVGNSQGLIPVKIDNVALLNDFLNDTQVAALNNVSVPVTVQVPISVAANVCGTTVAALADARKNGNGGCTAQSGSAALADIVTRQVSKQDKQ
jgi:hypothetical protein